MLAIASDHGGYELRQKIMEHLRERSIEYVDCGCATPDSCDYPDYARAACAKIISGECDRAILICGTGIGISIAANKIPGIRAALCNDCFSAYATRLHNDANALALGARVIGVDLALMIVDTFLDTPFSNEERHIRRIAKIEG